MIEMQVMKDAAEIVHYDRPGIPIYIKNNDLDEYTDRRCLYHWHDDIEIICVTEGKMNYYVNGRTVPLGENDCIVVNSRQLHYGFACRGHGCHFVCIRFHPKLFGGSQGIYESYMLPFTEHSGIEYLHYKPDTADAAAVKGSVMDILALKESKETAYELAILSILCNLWRILLRRWESSASPGDAPDNSNLALQRKMISFIYEHYCEPLTLEDIAASASISRSKCCIIFKQYLGQPPIGYLNKYRLEVSRYLLANTQSGITDIALSCGFNHPSYYTKTFSREYGCTPTQYRKETLL